MALRTMVRRVGMPVMKGMAAAADAVRRPGRGVVVLIYHRVGGGSGEIDQPLSLFDAQMAELAGSGRVVTLDEALGRLAGPAPADGADPVVVTFDDGSADFAEVAVPVLERHRVPATLYVATRFVEEQRAFPWGAPPVSWGALAECVTTGLVTVGSHTHSHLLLDRLDPAAVADELDRSVDLIGEHLGVEARHFAYPKAVAPSGPAEAAVRARFASAALAGTRPNPYGTTDPMRLARSPVQVSDGMRWFRRKLAGGMAAEDGLRRLLNRGRYAGATT